MAVTVATGLRAVETLAPRCIEDALAGQHRQYGTRGL
jgi:hypothetical protein